MKAFRLAAIAATSLALAISVPAAAQNFPMDEGEYVEMTGINVDDGHMLDYATWLSGYWKAQEDYAKSQGWTTGYKILANIHKRPGEPDLFLMRSFSTLPDAAESAKRSQMIRDHVKLTDAQMEAQSGDRAKFRHVVSGMMLQEYTFKK